MGIKTKFAYSHLMLHPRKNQAANSSNDNSSKDYEVIDRHIHLQKLLLRRFPQEILWKQINHKQNIATPQAECWCKFVFSLINFLKTFSLGI